VNAFIASQKALGRARVPDDIGPVIAALLSPSQRYIRNGNRERFRKPFVEKAYALPPNRWALNCHSIGARIHC